MFFCFSLLQLTGLILIVTGIVIQGVYSQYLDFLGSSFFNAPVLLIIVGFIIFFVTFFGCCGAIKAREQNEFFTCGNSGVFHWLNFAFFFFQNLSQENHCMTMTFSVLLGVIFLVEIGAGIAAYSMKTEVRTDLFFQLLFFFNVASIITFVISE